MANKYINGALDGLMFIVPIMELTDVISFIPIEYLPLYMLAVTVLRRVVRMLTEQKTGTTVITVENKPLVVEEPKEGVL